MLTLLSKALSCLMKVNPLSGVPLSVKLPAFGGMTVMRELPGPINDVTSRSTAVLSALKPLISNEAKAGSR